MPDVIEKSNRLFMVIVVVIVCTISMSTAAERPPAKPGEPITPRDFSVKFFPGLNHVGAVPKKQYVIAFSNGDMSNAWRHAFVQDVTSFGQKYAERFGIRFIWANAHANSSQQLKDVRNLLAQQPDLLIVSPNESAALTVIDQWCAQAGVPLICIDRGLDTEPGRKGSTYIALIQMDNIRIGIDNGIRVVKKLTEKYGEPRGNLVEIPGILGSSPAIHRSMGQHWVLSHFPKIRIVAMVPGDYAREKSFEAARDILKMWPRGTIDGMIGGCDESGMAFLEAAYMMGRKELVGYVWGSDGAVWFLEKILEGEGDESSEHAPYYGLFTFEYAIHYLNGETIPSLIMIPGRDYKADTPEQRAKLKEFVRYLRKHDVNYVPVELGGYELFTTDPEELRKYYPVPFYEDPKVLEKMNKIKPYEVQEPYMK